MNPANLDGNLSSRPAPVALSLVLNSSQVKDSFDWDGVPWGTYRQTPAMITFLMLAYIIVFILAIVNNPIVIAVIVRNPKLRTVTNYFLSNLAVADIIVSLLVLPITLLSNVYEGK